MMRSVIGIVEDITGEKTFETFRRCLDYERKNIVEYDYFGHEFMKEQGETQKYSGARDISSIASNWLNQTPISLFMDGSRRTYKIADLQIGTQVFPIISGQVGVGICRRKNRKIEPCRLYMEKIITLPDKLDVEGKDDKHHRAFFYDLKERINSNQKRLKIDAVIYYKTKSNENFEDKGIASIQDYMIRNEKIAVKNLVQDRIINDRNWLIKDGSLEYNKISDNQDDFAFSRIHNNYKKVIGVSKSFNPELAKLKNNRSAAGLIANLRPFERTPATMYETVHSDGKFAIWYVRLRNARINKGPFDGIVKIEKILCSEEVECGVNSDLVDRISAWIINERNPVCYGKDDRWANHLYPIHLTETYIKSKYISSEHFVNLF